MGKIEDRNESDIYGGDVCAGEWKYGGGKR